MHRERAPALAFVVHPYDVMGFEEPGTTPDGRLAELARTRLQGAARGRRPHSGWRSFVAREMR